MKDKFDWNSYMISYDRCFREVDPYNKMLKITLEALDLAANVLDSSAGSGNLTKKLLKQGKHVTTIDIFPGYVDIIEAKLSGHPEYFKRLITLIGDPQDTKIGLRSVALSGNIIPFEICFGSPSMFENDMKSPATP